jgi:hypothetical protein
MDTAGKTAEVISGQDPTYIYIFSNHRKNSLY